MRPFAMLAFAACSNGNSLPPPGVCNASNAGTLPVAMPIKLADTALSFDDLRYAPSLDKVIAAPAGLGKVFLIDPDDDSVMPLDEFIPTGIASADGKGALVFAVDRANRRIEIIDVFLRTVTGETQLDDAPDYIRASPTSDEVWVTFPGAGKIEVFATSTTPPSATRTASIDVGDPEGLVFDGAGLAYTNDGGHVVQIDAATHEVLNRWSDGCGSSHGFPVVDTALGLVFGGCADNGGAGVLESAGGGKRSGIEAGGGPAILAYDEALHHLYLRGDGAPTLDIVGVCADGGLTVLGEVAIPSSGHGATAEGGRVWVCDPANGGVVKITDPYPSSE